MTQVPELDLTVADTKCGSDSPSVRIMRFWVEVGGEKDIIIKALKGVQVDQVDMWAIAMEDKGVKILEKKDEGNSVLYKVRLP
jgi:hypothetical protein